MRVLDRRVFRGLIQPFGSRLLGRVLSVPSRKALNVFLAGHFYSNRCHRSLDLSGYSWIRSAELSGGCNSLHPYLWK